MIGIAATVAMPRLIAEIGVRLEPPEVREHVLEAPARIAERGPLVVVGRGAPQREPRHPRSAAQEPAPRQVLDDAARIRLRRIAPVGLPRNPPAVAQHHRAGSLADQGPPPAATPTATPTPPGAPPRRSPQPRRPRRRRQTSRLRLPGAGSGAQHANQSTLAASFPEHDLPHDPNLPRRPCASEQATERPLPAMQPEKWVGGEPGASIAHQHATLAGDSDDRSRPPAGMQPASASATRRP